MASRTAVVDGIRMRWEESGAGSPLVLVHGIPTGPALWRHVVPRLGGARCLAWEMVGYGASMAEGCGRDLSVGRQAEYLVRWLEHLGLERVVLAGHDLGGGVVQIAAVRRPDLCRGLFLADAVAYDSWPIASLKAARAGGFLLRHLPDAAFQRVLRAFLRRGHVDRAQAEEALAVHGRHYARHGGAAVFLRQAEALDARDTLAVAGALPGLAIPSRIVWGAADPFQALAYGERLARDLSAPLHAIEGGRHFTPEDNPDVVAREIERLIAEAGTRA